MGLQRSWYNRRASWNLLLLPLEWLFVTIASYNKLRHQKKQWQAPCPLLIVGNISVGGTGKSPLTIELIQILQNRGYKLGVVSRGYGAHRADFPYQVKASDTAAEAPDEPLMIVQRTGVNLVIDPNRVRACQYLLANNECDLILSDDGLQHYQMGRDIEIAVIDASRGLGNGHCLPVGPLRESQSRLECVDYVLLNGTGEFSFNNSHQMQIAPCGWYRVKDNQYFSLDRFAAMLTADDHHGKIHAIAGIGNPQRFFDTLQQLKLQVIEHSFADHYQYSPADINFEPADIVCMTEKDAVKCRQFAAENCYYLRITAQLESIFIDKLCRQLETVRAAKANN
ncbi:MAG: tetraacyldisaccharide 4'-kinase [Pseudomonadales bacterium]|nr:tetraacyldisaccharide 4'-kinase [Pseudomonadales bacterium]NRA13994.1 tetraacyldisaccharide 4'-kinase [Oceanospirillaceae bacterium]